MNRQAKAERNPKPNLGLRERQKHQRRQRMLDAASELFNRHGYEAVTVEEIAAHADLSAATVHNYYKGKARLLLAIVEQGDALLIEELHEIAKRNHADAAEAVNAVMNKITEGSLAYLKPKVWRYAIAASIVREDQAYGKGFAHVHGQFTEALIDVLRSLQTSSLLPIGIDVETLASIIYRVQHSLFVELIAEENPDEETYRAAHDTHVQLILNAVAPRNTC